MQNVIFEGSWTLSRLVLQLFPWHAFFQPVSARLSTAAIWLQLHHLPNELWDKDILENIVGHTGKLLKIDDETINLSRAKYARICMELDLT